MTEKVELSQIDKIIKETIKRLEEGKEQIYGIGETARQERNELRDTIAKIKQEVLETIDKVDELEKQEKKARVHLMKVSREYERYTEEDVKDAYNHARDIQIQLGLLRGQEQQLRLRRDQMEMALRRLNETVEKAENLTSTVGVALNYLLTNLQGVGFQIEAIQQKQQLGLRVIKAQEEERKRVAREIHDGPAQSMANVVLRVEICEKLLDKDPEEVRQELSDLKGLVKASLRDVRQIIFDLRPMVLDDLGLVPALKRYFSELEDTSSLIVDYRAEVKHEERLSSTLEIAIFRIIQEAINNVLKHSGARIVTVRLETAEEQINVRIKDDGCGFDLDKAMEGSQNDNYGLIGIRERVQLLEGDFKVNTAPGKGTDVLVKIPLEDQKNISGRK